MELFFSLDFGVYIRFLLDNIHARTRTIIENP